jgi:predicted dinucleotide-binding enzyme
MQFGVLGTGTVGQALASKLVSLGHLVCMGARSADNEKATAWADAAGPKASHGTFADAAAFGEMVLNCTAGTASLQALEAAGADNLAGKVLIDLSNPLDFSNGFPPRLTVCNDDSLGEQIQRAFPAAKVVKTLNTMSNQIMVHPTRVPGGHDVFVSGDDADAKARVVELLQSFGWEQPIDLGDITTSRGVEMWLPLWVRLYGTLGTPDFQLKLVRA